jgi:hypothetical protein
MLFFLMDGGKIAAADCNKAKGKPCHIIKCHLTQVNNHFTRWNRPALKSRELFLIWILISLIEIYCQLYWKDADEKETAMVQGMWRAEQATIYIPIGIGLGPGEYIVHQTVKKRKWN